MKYVSEDNKVFNTEAECKAHEAELAGAAEAREHQKAERIAAIHTAISDMMGFIDGMIEEFMRDFPEMANKPFNIVIHTESKSEDSE